MNEVVVLTPERILEVTEDVLRRYGLAKATVVDVARALDVSHGSVYRHFPSKASLREAVAKRWLDRLSAPLLKIAEASGPAPARLEKWLRTMFSIKHKRLGDDPEMFATYLTLAREACKAVNCHKDCLVDQIAMILSDGVEQGAFEVADVKVSARAIFDATSRFHHPAHAGGMERAGCPGADRCAAGAAAQGFGSAAQALMILLSFERNRRPAPAGRLFFAGRKAAGRP
jgi:AcrR family transcriptional regulator